MAAPRDLLRAMLTFGGMLRASGLQVTTSALMDAVRALEAVDLMDRAEVYLTLQTVLMSRIEEQPAFDRCFEAFWKFHADEGQGLDGLVAAVQQKEQDDAPEAAPLETAPERQARMALDDWNDPGEATDDEPLEVPGLSDREALMEQDFSTFPAEQLDEVARLTVQIAKRLARRVSRRRKPTRRGGMIDQVRLVLLCDVSGSMDLYSRFLLQFLYALQNVFGRVETFTFSTRLTRVSDLLRGPSYKRALRRLTEVRDWSGGTRIGESIREFNQTWGRLVDRRTIVLVLSDGWDTGEPEVLAKEMLALKRRAARVIWLNPLLGNPSYEPLTRGMAAALPLVDHFAAAHNLASLRELAGHLNVR